MADFEGKGGFQSIPSYNNILYITSINIPDENWYKNSSSDMDYETYLTKITIPNEILKRYGFSDVYSYSEDQTRSNISILAKSVGTTITPTTTPNYIGAGIRQHLSDDLEILLMKNGSENPIIDLYIFKIIPIDKETIITKSPL